MSALQPQPTDKHASWAWSESRATEDDVVLRARERAAELEVPPVSEGTAALLTVLAATRAPAAVVEVGTGAGVSGLALMRGLPERTVLTTVDPDAEAQRAAREAFSEARLPTSRTRMITGRSRLVLPRLTSGAYEMVLVDGDPAARQFDVEQAARMLAPGGVLVVVDALEALLELAGLVRVDLQHETAAAVDRHAHDQAAPLLGHFHGTVPGAGLHGGHCDFPSG